MFKEAQTIRTERVSDPPLVVLKTYTTAALSVCARIECTP
jgi:hypothetical protein